MLEELMNDKVSLVKKNGTEVHHIQALVQAEMIFVDDASVPVEEGDIISRELPNGLIEKYIVIDRGYTGSIFGVPAHYQIKVRKESTLTPRQAPSAVTYNLHGPHSRVNVNSEDRSINVSNVKTESVFKDLRQTIQNQVASIDDQHTLLSKLTEMEEAKGSATFTEKYRDFVALAADYMTILAPFIPALTQFLS